MDLSIITACMNREGNLLKALPTWLNLNAKEIVIVDWSSTTPVVEALEQHGIKDNRIRIVRVEDEDRWILTHAYNVGLKQATGEIILKLDNDHTVSTDFLERNQLQGLDCRLGSWRLANSPEQAYVNGAFLIKGSTLRNVGFFNELITTYGWDDSYLHESLFADGAKIGHIDPESIYHLEQEHASRTKNQKVSQELTLAISVDKDITEFMNRRNMYLSSLLPRQSQNIWQSSYEDIKINNNIKVVRRIADSRPDTHLPASYIQLANRLAYRDFHCWSNGMNVITTSLEEIEKIYISIIDPKSVIEQSTATQNLSAQHTADSNHIEKDLWKRIPLLLSAYGHTNNINSYFLRLHESDENIDMLNNIVPAFCKPKVAFLGGHSSQDSQAVEIYASRENMNDVVSKLLFESDESNQYFWAAFNCLKPRHKRCLYEMIENCSPPHKLLKQYVNNNLETLARTNKLAEFLEAIAICSPALGQSPEACLGTQLYNRIKNIINNQSDSSPEIFAAFTNTSNSFALTLVTSLFKGSKYIITYALNLKRMSLFMRTEVIIYIVPSSESRYCYDYLQRFFANDGNVIVELLTEDPGLYECWNMGAKRARGRYVSNANVDDRRGKYHSDSLIALAEINKLDAASSALMADEVLSENSYTDTQDIWFTGMGRNITSDDLAISKDGKIESQNLLHCMPIWRKSIHSKIGYFDEVTYGTSADWEFWMRACFAECKMQVFSPPLGFYLVDPNSHNRRHTDKEEKENMIIARYVKHSLQ